MTGEPSPLLFAPRFMLDLKSLGNRIARHLADSFLLPAAWAPVCHRVT